MIYKRTFKTKTGEKKECRRWSYRFEIDKVTYTGSCGTANRQLALSEEAKQRLAIERGEAGFSPRLALSFADFVSDHFIGYVQPRVSKRTFVFYLDALQHALDYAPLASTKITEVDEAALEPFIRHLQTRPGRTSANLSPVTINHALRAIRRVLHVAERLKKIPAAPALCLLEEPPGRDFVITDEQMADLIALCKPRPADVEWSAPRESMPPEMAPLLPVLYDSGMRAGEAARLVWADIDWESGEIQIQIGKTKNARRRIPMSAKVRAILTDLQKTATASHVFTRGNGQPITVGWASHNFTWAARKLGLKGCVLHSCRHSALTRWGRAGMDAFAIMRMAGHANITQSEKYTHTDSAWRRSAMNLLDKQKPDYATVSNGK